jgi:hypothetical protein
LGVPGGGLIVKLPPAHLHYEPKNPVMPVGQDPPAAGSGIGIVTAIASGSE